MRIKICISSGHFIPNLDLTSTLIFATQWLTQNRFFINVCLFFPRIVCSPLPHSPPSSSSGSFSRPQFKRLILCVLPGSPRLILCFVYRWDYVSICCQPFISVCLCMCVCVCVCVYVWLITGKFHESWLGADFGNDFRSGLYHFSK